MFNYPKPPIYYTQFKEGHSFSPFSQFDQVPEDQPIKIFEQVAKFQDFTRRPETQKHKKEAEKTGMKQRIKKILFLMAQYLDSLTTCSPDCQHHSQLLAEEIGLFMATLDRLKQGKGQKLDVIQLYQSEVARI